MERDPIVIGYSGGNDEKDNHEQQQASSAAEEEVRLAKGVSHHESIDITESKVDHGRFGNAEHGVLQHGSLMNAQNEQSEKVPKVKGVSSVVSDNDGDFGVLIKANMHLAQLIMLDKSLNQNDSTELEKEIDETFDMDLFSRKPHTWKERLIQPFKIIFLTMELENSSTVAWIWSLTSKLVILIAIFSSIIATEPLFSFYPTTCLTPSCQNDPVLCPNATLCAPQPYPIFDTIDTICIYIFTAEYAARFLTCWSVSAKVAGVAPKVDPVVNKVLKVTMKPTEYHPLVQMVRWSLCVKNLIDLACWLPFYIGTLIGLSPRYSSFIRALRLLRLVRVLR